MKDYLDEYIVATRLIYRPEGATVEELSEALGKTQRAVFSILNQLDNMFPLYTVQDSENPRKLRYKADKTFAEYLPDLEFTESDKAVFNYLVSNVANTPAIEKDFNRLFNKIKLMAAERGALIEAGYNKPIPILGANTIHKVVDKKDINHLMETLLIIIKEKKWMDITYKSMRNDEYHPRKNLFPLVMFIWHGDTYLYAINENGFLRMFAIERFKSIDRVFTSNAPKEEYDINALLSDPFGIFYDTKPFEVKLLLNQIEATYEMQKEWPSTVTFIKNEDGSAVMTATTHSIFDCKRWILARLPRVKVIEPDWLKNDIHQTIVDALEDF